MKILTCAGFCEELPPDIANCCQKIGSGIRTGVCIQDEHPMVERLVRNALFYFKEAVFIVAGWDHRLPNGHTEPHQDAILTHHREHFLNQCSSIIAAWRQYGGKDENLWIEIGNELDNSYWKAHLNDFHHLAIACYDRVRSVSPTVNVITGSTANFNKEFSWKRGGYEVLDELCGYKWPVDTLQGLHSYRGPGRIWASFDSDAAALRELKKVLRGRQVAITEYGWASDRGLTDETIAEFVKHEIKMWREFGAVMTCYYQIQDPTIGDREGARFGAFTNQQDGLEPKPVAAVLMGAKLE